MSNYITTYEGDGIAPDGTITESLPLAECSYDFEERNGIEQNGQLCDKPKDYIDGTGYSWSYNNYGQLTAWEVPSRLQT